MNAVLRKYDQTEILSAQAPRFRLVKEIKGSSSRELRRDFSFLKRRLPTLWTNRYFVSTVGGAPLALVKQYIENQKHV
jgi:putative transposase